MADPVDPAEMTEDEIIAEIIYLIEVGLWKRDSTRSQVLEMKFRLDALIKALDEGPKKSKIVAKIEAKNRYNYLINDTGILDATGYGGNFY